MTATRSVLVRADGSSVLGMGNVTRSLAIADELHKRGYRIVCLSRDIDVRVRDHVTRAGFEYRGMAAGLSLAEDASYSRRMMRELGRPLVVVDLANPEATRDMGQYSAYFHAIADECLGLIVVDDLTNAKYPTGFVVNPNTEVEAADVGGTAQYLFGPRYAIVAPSYRDAARSRVYEDAPVRRAVVALGGGVVASDLLHRVLRGIHDALGGGIALDVMIGFGVPAAFRASPMFEGFAGEVRLHSNLPSLRDPLLEADIAFVSGGVTKYEAAATGTPAVIVASIDHQEAWGAAFARTGAAMYAGGPETASIASVARVTRSLVTRETRKQMGTRGAELVDGWGTKRIVDAALARLAG